METYLLRRIQPLNEMAEFIKRNDNLGFIVKVYSGGKEHNPPHAHVFSVDGRGLTRKKGQDCRILLPKHSYLVERDNIGNLVNTNLTYEDIVPYRCELTIKVRKELAYALNHVCKGADYKAWIEMIIYWNTFHYK